MVNEEYNLAVLFPDIAAQWHPELNGDVTPDKVAPRSNKKYWWLCEKGHAYDVTPDNRTAQGQGCPYCANRRVLKGFNDLKTTFPNIAKEWDYSKNEGNPEDYTYRSTYRAHWMCSTCGHQWENMIKDRTESKYQTCPKCANKLRGAERHENNIKKNGGITDPRLLADWDYERNKKGPEEYAKQSMEKAFWVCPVCGYRWEAKISNRANGRGCPCCGRKIVVPGINDLATTHPALAAEWHPTKNGDLKPSDVLSGQARKIWWVCPEGHEYQASLLHRSSGTNCPVCNSGRQTSFAEQAVYYYVKKVFPDAISRYRDIFNKGMELDIYIPSIKLGIEYDGLAWHKADKFERERKKYLICQEHGIKLLRLKERNSEDFVRTLQTCDESLSVGGDMFEHKNLADAIQFLMDRLDPVSNMWTRKKPIFHSPVNINIDRDEMEIRRYMTRLKESFADKFPELAKEWHPTKNGDLTPDKVLPYSDIYAWWVCPNCGHEYRTTVGRRAYGSGCIKCGFLKSARTRFKPVIMIDLKTNKEIKTFESLSLARAETGINLSNIVEVCRGKRKKAGGYGWRYADK